MITYTDKKAQEQSTFVFSITFKDENGDAVTPDSVKYSLVDSSGNYIDSLQDQSVTPASTVDIVLTGDNLQILAAEVDETAVMRYLIIEAVYDSDYGNDLTFKEEISFILENLKKVS